MILVALGVGFGETYLWPRLVIVFGPDIRWLFTVGVLVQTVVMLEMARYAMATGESIFFGAARICQTADVVLLRGGDPGLHLAGAHLRRRRGARGDHRHPVAAVRHAGPGRHRRDVHRRDLHLQPDRGAAGLPRGRAGDRLGHRRRGGRQPGRPRRHARSARSRSRRASRPRPSRRRSSRSSSARSPSPGPSGMQQMWYTLWLRDKGAGMGVHIPKVRGLLHADEEETIPDAGARCSTPTTPRRCASGRTGASGSPTTPSCCSSASRCWSRSSSRSWP